MADQARQIDTRTTAFPAPGDPDVRTALRHRRWIYAVATVVLAATMGSLAVDAASGSLAIWGVESRTVVDRAPGLTLEVTYTEVARPGLAAPFHVVVRRDGGFDNDIELAFPGAYFRLWDVNGLFPEPKSWRSEGDRLVFTFDPPDDERSSFEWFYEARIEPARQSGERGFVAVLDGGEPEAIVRFHTRVMP